MLDSLSLMLDSNCPQDIEIQLCVQWSSRDQCSCTCVLTCTGLYVIMLLQYSSFCWNLIKILFIICGYATFFLGYLISCLWFFFLCSDFSMRKLLRTMNASENKKWEIWRKCWQHISRLKWSFVNWYVIQLISYSCIRVPGARCRLSVSSRISHLLSKSVFCTFLALLACKDRLIFTCCFILIISLERKII